MAGGCVAVETPVVTRVVCLVVPTVVNRSVGLTDVSLPAVVVPSVVSLVVVVSPVGFSVFWQPGRVKRNSLI